MTERDIIYPDDHEAERSVQLGKVLADAALQILNAKPVFSESECIGGVCMFINHVASCLSSRGRPAEDIMRRHRAKCGK